MNILPLLFLSLQLIAAAILDDHHGFSIFTVTNKQNYKTNFGMCSSRTYLSQLQYSKMNHCTRVNYSSIKKTRKVDKVQNNLRRTMTPRGYKRRGGTFAPLASIKFSHTSLTQHPNTSITRFILDNGALKP